MNDTSGMKYWSHGFPWSVSTANDASGVKYWLDGLPYVAPATAIGNRRRRFLITSAV